VEHGRPVRVGDQAGQEPLRSHQRVVEHPRQPDPDAGQLARERGGRGAELALQDRLDPRRQPLQIGRPAAEVARRGQEAQVAVLILGATDEIARAEPVAAHLLEQLAGAGEQIRVLGRADLALDPAELREIDQQAGQAVIAAQRAHDVEQADVVGGEALAAQHRQIVRIERHPPAAALERALAAADRHAHAVAAGRARRAQRLLRAAQEIDRLAGVVGEPGDPDAHAGERLTGERGPLDRGAKPLGLDRGALLRGLGQEDGDLAARHPPGHVALAQA